MLSDPQALAQVSADAVDLGGALSRLLVVAERYPDLKGESVFSPTCRTSSRAQRTGSMSHGSRYNKAVQEFNTSIRTFPNSLTNSLLLHLTRKEPFKADEGARTAPKVKF